MQIYDQELEARPEFGAFQDFIRSFVLLRGKKTFDMHDTQRRYAGMIKVTILSPEETTIYLQQQGNLVLRQVGDFIERCDDTLSEEVQATSQTAAVPIKHFVALPSSCSHKVLVRVYIISVQCKTLRCMYCLNQCRRAT